VRGELEIVRWPMGDVVMGPGDGTILLNKIRGIEGSDMHQSYIRICPIGYKQRPQTLT
jgi:hypothetical protein